MTKTELTRERIAEIFQELRDSRGLQFYSEEQIEQASRMSPQQRYDAMCAIYKRSWQLIYARYKLALPETLQD